MGQKGTHKWENNNVFTLLFSHKNQEDTNICICRGTHPLLHFVIYFSHNFAFPLLVHHVSPHYFDFLLHFPINPVYYFKAWKHYRASKWGSTCTVTSNCNSTISIGKLGHLGKHTPQLNLFFVFGYSNVSTLHSVSPIFYDLTAK